MANTLRESYNVDSPANGAHTPNGTEPRWIAQTFTASGVYFCTSIKLWMYRTGTPGTITVELRNAVPGVPVEPGVTIHVSGTTNGNTLTDSSVGEWREIVFSAPFQVASGTDYAIVVHAASANNSTNKIHVWSDGSTPGAAGDFTISSDLGSSWLDFSASFDLYYEVWGEGAIPPSSGPDITQIRKLVAAAANTILYEDFAYFGHKSI